MNFKLTKRANNVGNVGKFCTGCGGCFAICPQNSIVMENSGKLNYPVILDNCLHCGLCLRVCPGINLFSKEVTFKNQNVGTDVYTISSRCPEINMNGSSGGFITGYLMDLIDKKSIDGAVVVKTNGFGKTEAFIARTKEELMAASGSKYCPVSVCSIIKQLTPNEKYAFIGKGCDLAFLKLLEKYNPSFKKMIYIKIGIMCHHTPYLDATRELLNLNGFNADSNVIYRSEGWPGKTIISNCEKSYELDYKTSWGEHLGKSRNTPFCCSICTRGLAENADFVVGDAWAFNLNLENKKYGYSLVYVYSERGLSEILKLSKDNFDVEFKDQDILVKSQKNLIDKLIVSYYKLAIISLSRRDLKSFRVLLNNMKHITSKFGLKFKFKYLPRLFKFMVVGR
uniref:Coenzyme F420 hydrogenase/dehydrogenase beta subunit domain protein n=1 Tax=Methanococcus maripaludis (strain C6 / ATCC BAA-1332) TaxID=444158 RepID=A9A6X4_METM6